MTTESGALVALSNDIADAVDRVAASVVAVEARGRIGSSGFYLRPNVVVTADHTLESDEVEVVFADGVEERATIVGRDPSTDLALLRTEREGVPLALAHAEVRVGSIALAVARDDDGDLAATMGVISAVSGAWRTWQGGEIDRFVRPDLALYPRFSGSPLVNADGHAIGLNTAGLSRRRVLTVPSATIARVADVLLARGHIARGYAGVALQHVRLPEAFGGGHGAVVVGVETQSPAERGGVIVGDVIVGVGGSRADIEDVHAAISGGAIGSALALDVVRGGTPTRVEVTLGERPENDA